MHRLAGLALPALVAAAAALAGCGSTGDCGAAPLPADHYDDDASWLCSPGSADDACAGDLTATEIKPDGSLETVPHEGAAQPGADCFYVYPTVHMSLGAAIDDVMDPQTDVSTALAQAARFSEICNVHAPLYRQMGLGTYAVQDVDKRKQCFDTAYGDVALAFRSFLERAGDDGPIVLLGHSQGAQMLTRLVHDFFDSDDDKALRDRLLVSVMPGAAVAVPRGEVVGGSFAHVPLCEGPDQTGCVVAYRSAPPGGAPHLGRDPDDVPELVLADGQELACTAPTDGPLSRSFLPSSWPGVDVDTPFVLYRDRYQGHCVRHGDDGSVLEITGLGDLDKSDADQRGDPVELDAARWQKPLGLHVTDLQLAQGDLIDGVHRRLAVWNAAHGR